MATRKSRSRLKKVSYVLQVQCEKIPDMNEPEFLAEIRRRINGGAPTPVGQFPPEPITFGGTFPRISVLKRIEEFISPAKEEK